MLEIGPQRVGAAKLGGYTIVELVVVMAVTGILAAYVAPRFWNQQAFSDRGYADELAAALRATQKAAVITGCPAQLTLTANSYAAAQQAALGGTCNPADIGWSTPILGPDGSTIQNSAPSNTTAAPATALGAYQFDSQGRLASSPSSSTSITVGTHTITIVAGTGLVQVL
jgi:prepilin-type N-terminal cleavage/methylation domain-containing protein